MDLDSLSRLGRLDAFADAGQLVRCLVASGLREHLRRCAAFEHGHLDADSCGKRIAELRIRLDLLSRRRKDLEHRLIEPLGRPSEKAIAELRQMLWDVFKHGTPGQRKAIIEINVEEITVEGNKIVPVFRVPEEAIEPVDDSTGSSDAVRA